MVYPPNEDSFLLETEIKRYIFSLKNKNIRVLDMGSGSGIQALAAINAGINKENILCADIDREAIKELKRQKLKAIKSDLFSKIKGRFDLIIFNAPYLPEDKYDRLPDTTAGKRGNEVIIKFLKSAKSHLIKDGAILLLFSSLSKPKEILNEAKRLKYKAEKLTEQKLFFEKLEVWKLF